VQEMMKLLDKVEVEVEAVWKKRHHYRTMEVYCQTRWGYKRWKGWMVEQETGDERQDVKVEESEDERAESEDKKWKPLCQNHGPKVSLSKLQDPSS
jgi:hypothetical protein